MSNRPFVYNYLAKMILDFGFGGIKIMNLFLSIGLIEKQFLDFLDNHGVPLKLKDANFTHYSDGQNQFLFFFIRKEIMDCIHNEKTILYDSQSIRKSMRIDQNSITSIAWLRGLEYSPLIYKR